MERALSRVRTLRRWARRRVDRITDAAARWLPDRVIYARTFKRNFGRRLNLREPCTFNEKLYWLMLHYRLPIVTRLADKYAVRGFVAERIGEKYLNDVYGVWDDPAAIDFDELPDTFVLKVAGGWNMNVFCRDRAGFDPEAARRQLVAWLGRPHYRLHHEWAYKNIPPRVIAERLLVDTGWSAPTDYKVSCFNGEPLFIGVHVDRFGKHRRDFVDPKWQLLPFTKRSSPTSGQPVPQPDDLEEMLACARRLAEGFPFVRVDFLGENGRIVFGEMTWYPAAAQNLFVPESYDRYWGDALQLPARRRWW